MPFEVRLFVRTALVFLAHSTALGAAAALQALGMVPFLVALWPRVRAVHAP
jgi:hypothetical protein